MALLKRGLSGEPVRLLQEKLGVDADGIFGGGTDAALRKYQGDNGLAVDGIAGPDTFSHMGLFELVLLRHGSRGSTVKKMQESLGIGADGIFGGGTEKAVMAFQESNGLDADGMVGPDTLAKMDLFAAEVTEEVVERSFLPPSFKAIEIPAIFKGKAEKEDEAEMPEVVEEVVKAVEAKEKKTGRKGIWGSVKSLFGRK